MRNILIIFFLICSFSLPAQTLNYAIRLKDELIGHMTAVKKGKGKSELMIESKIMIEKMIKLDLLYRIDAVFENNILSSSLAVQNNNGKEFTNSKTTKDKSGYTIKTLKEEKAIYQKFIHYNLCKLYFEEPIGISSVYSDTYGEFLSLKPAGKHRYEMILPDGKSNFYSYNHGICTLVELELIFGKITFQLTK